MIIHAKRLLLLSVFFIFVTAPLHAQSALQFGGTNAYVTFGNTSTLGLPQFTIECWFMRSGSGVTASTGTGGVVAVPLVSKGRGEADGSNLDMNWFLGIRGTDSVLVADFEEITPGPNPGLNHPVIGITPLLRNVWYHAAATYNGTAWTLYLNGQTEAQTTVGVTPQSGSIQHAAIASALTSTGAPSGYFHGTIDEVRIWNTARSQQQIQSGINQQMSTPQPGLVACWGLNEGTGTTTGDISGNNVGGSILNTNWSWTGGAPFNINIPPAPPIPVTPADNATCVPTVAPLYATASDVSGGTLTLNFYGRPVNTDPDFTLLPIPDTQFYTSELNGGTNAHYKAQTNWIVANRVSRNIVFIPHLGDCVQNGDNGGNDIEWKRADTAMKIIENPVTTTLPDGIPYGMNVGNHDQSPFGDPNGTTAFFNQYFGAARFAGRNYWGGCYGQVNCDNNFQLFSAGSLDFIAISLEYDVTANALVLNWADSLLNAYPNRRGIIFSHYLLDAAGTYSAQGTLTYNALKSNPNLFLMLCGHVPNGEAMRSDVFNNNTIRTLLSDYQSRSNGGDGWMRIMTFSPSLNQVAVQTYSPTLNLFETDANSQFTFSYDMGLPWQLIGSVTINSGDTGTVNWNGLNSYTNYEWYTTVSDGNTTVNGPVQHFTTNNGNAVNLGNNIVQCGGTAVLNPQTACTNCSYLWSTGDTTLGLTVQTSGMYALTETDTAGCTAHDSVSVIIHPVPVVQMNLTQDTLCSTDIPLLLSGLPGGGIFNGPGVTGNQFNPQTVGTGSYTLYYTSTDSNGCSNSDSAVVRVEICTDVTDNPVYALYCGPNPANEQLTVVAPAGAGELRIELCSSEGRIVLRRRFTGKTVLPVKTIPAGMYLLRIYYDTGMLTQRVLIAH